MSVVDQIKANLAALSFDNPSDEAIYNKIAQAIGLPIDNTITELTNSENRILALITDKNYGKNLYYVTSALAFQYGDDLIVDPVTKNDVYAVIDTSKQIISQAAFQDIDGELFLKVAKTNGVSGDLEALNPDEYSAFSDYFLNFEIPGLPVSIISATANILSFNLDVTYQKTYNLTNLQSNLLAALSTFRRSFIFNGTFYTQDQEDFVKNNVPGIRSAFMFNTGIDGSAFGGEATLSAGYFNYIAGFETNITYTGI